MESATFDTLTYANKLKAAGVPEKQAEAQVEILAEIIESNLATKRDLKKLEVALRHDIEAMSYKPTIRLGGMLTVAVGVLAVLMKIL